MYVCMYACMSVCRYVGMHACMHVCMYVCMYACMYVYMYVCMYVYICMYMYMCKRTYIYMHHIHIYTYVYITNDPTNPCDGSKTVTSQFSRCGSRRPGNPKSADPVGLCEGNSGLVVPGRSWETPFIQSLSSLPSGHLRLSKLANPR